MNTIEMLASIVVLLGEVEVHGEANINRMRELFQRLGAVMNGIKQETAKHAEDIAALEKQLRQKCTPPPPAEGETVMGGEIIDLDTGEVIGNVNDKAE